MAKKKKNKYYEQSVDELFEEAQYIPIEPRKELHEQRVQQREQQSRLFDGGSGSLGTKIKNTSADFGLNITKGILGATEGVSDFTRRRTADVLDKFGFDNKAKQLRNTANQNTTEGIASDFEHILYGDLSGSLEDEDIDVYEKIHDKSYLTDRSRGIAQSVGYSVTNAVMSTAMGGGNIGSLLLTGVSAGGSAESRAIEQGMDEDDAFIYGILSGSGEAVSEAFFGGVGKFTKALGYGKGALDDVLIENVTKRIGSNILKSLTSYGLRAGGEGFEEILSAGFDTLAQKASGMDERSLLEIWQDQNVGQAFVDGVISSMFSSSPRLAESVFTGKNYDTGMTRNEQKVIDNIVEERTKGQKLSNKELSDVRQKVQDQLIDGKLSMAEIDKALGDTNLNFAKDKYITRTMVNENTKFTTNDDDLKINKSQLNKNTTLEDVQNKIKVLEQDFLNANNDMRNTVSSHELFNEMKNMIVATGEQQRLTSYKQLEQDGMVKLLTDKKGNPIRNGRGELQYLKADTNQLVGINGFHTEDGMTLNADSHKIFEATMGHELGESLKANTPEIYKQLRDLAVEVGRADGTLTKETFDAIKQAYGELGTNTDNYLDEYVNDKIGEMFKSDSAMFQEIGKKPNIARRLLNEIKYLIQKFTAGSPEQKRLLEAQHNLKKALHESVRNLNINQEQKTDNIQQQTTEDIAPIKEQVKETPKEFTEVTDEDLFNIDLKEVENQLNKDTYKLNEDADDNTPFGNFWDLDEMYFNLKDGKTLWLSTPREYGKYKNGKTNYQDENYNQIDFTIYDSNDTSADNIIDEYSIKNEKGEFTRDDILNAIKHMTYDDSNKVADGQLDIFDNVHRNDGHRYSLSQDSQGRELSEQQQEYFKDSKVRDDEGNLLVVYRGEPEIGKTVYESKKGGGNKEINEYGIYFTNSKEFADQFAFERIHTDDLFFDKKGKEGETKQAYLNITNPLDFAKLTEQEIRDLYPYESSMAKQLYDEETFVSDMLRFQKIGNHQLMKSYLDMKDIADNTDYDGLIAKVDVKGNDLEYAVFNSNQIKNVDNLNPTTNKDTRYSLSVSEANTGKDNEGRTLSKGTQDYFKDSRATDEKGNLITVYHTTSGTDLVMNKSSFYEFNPVGTPGYRYGNQVVNFFTDSQDMSGSYVDQNYTQADTSKIESLEQAQGVVDYYNSSGLIDYEIRDNNGSYELYDVENDEVLHTFTSQDDLFRNIKNEVIEQSGLDEDVNYDGYQYEGYLNLTNPYIVENERPTNWDSVGKDYGQDLKDFYKSLTKAEKKSINDAMGWEDWGVFKDEISKYYRRKYVDGKDVSEMTYFSDGSEIDYGNTMAELGKKLHDLYTPDAPEGSLNLKAMSDMYDIASDNFKTSSINKFAYRELTTNDIVKQVLEMNENGSNYDGVIFKQIYDYGGDFEGERTPNNVYVTFNSNQFKSFDNQTPTIDNDIRYSISSPDDISPFGEGIKSEQVKPRDIQEAIAPLQDDIKKLNETIKELQQTTKSDVPREYPTDLSDLTVDPTPFMDMIEGTEQANKLEQKTQFIIENHDKIVDSLVEKGMDRDVAQDFLQQQVYKYDKQYNKIQEQRKEKPNNKLQKMILDFQDKWTNRNAHIDKLAKDSGNQMIKYKGDIANNSFGQAQYNIETAQTDLNGVEIGKSINDIFKPFKKQGLGAIAEDYLFHKSNIERHAIGKGSQVPSAISEQFVRDYEAQYPELRKLEQDVRTYYDNLLNLEIDAGLITQDDFNLLRGESDGIYRSYVPFYESDMEKRYFDDAGNLRPPKTLKRAKGGAKNIMGIQEAMNKQTMAVWNSMRTNQLYQEIINTLGGEEGLGFIVRNDPSNLSQSLYTDQDGNKFLTAYVDGREMSTKISDELYNELSRKGENDIKALEEKYSPLIKPLQWASNLRRNLLTSYNPFFALWKNPVKDVQDAILYSKHTAKMIENLGLFKAHRELLMNKTKEAKQFRALYGSNEYKGIGKGYAAVSEIIELAPRFAEFKASLQAGDSVEQAIYNAREVTTNFGRGGYVTKAMNRNGFTFLNASVQGFSKFIRNFSEQPNAGQFAMAVGKAAMLGVLPAIFNDIAFGSGDDKDEDYEALPNYIKDNYYLFKKSDGTFVRIPKGRALSVMGSAARRTIEYAEGDEEAFEGYLSNAWSQIGPVEIAANPLDNTIVAPIVQALGGEKKANAQNTSGRAWYGGDIVPSRLQKERPEDQYDASIDKFSIWLGQKTGVSPYKINYVLDQYTGGLGDVALPMMTEETNNGAESVGEYVLAPLKDQLIVNSIDDNKYASKFYDAKDKLYVGSKATDEDKLKSQYMNDVSWDLSALYKEKREVQADSSLSKKEKYAKVQAIQEQINAIAKAGYEGYQDVDISGNYAVVNDDRGYYKNAKGEWKAESQSDIENVETLGLTDNEKSNYYSTKNELYEIGTKYQELKQGKTDEEKTQLNKLQKQENLEAIKNAPLPDSAKYSLYDSKYDDKLLPYYEDLGFSANDIITYKEQTFTADKDKKGKTIRNSKKTKVFNYINNMKLPIEQKAILLKKEYPTIKTYDRQIFNYINNSDIELSIKRKILDELNIKYK